MFLRLLVCSVSLFFVNCFIENAETCTDCISGALKLQIEDSSDNNPILGARIVVTNNHNDTLISYDTTDYWSPVDSTYRFPGIPGVYAVHFSHPDYTSFEIADIVVTQWDEVTCEHANTENLHIRVDKVEMAKKAANSGYTVIDQFENGHCF